MNVLVTGASGMLGATLVDKWKDKFDIYATDIEEMKDNPSIKFFKFDLSCSSYEQLIHWAEPNVIVHCAAITNVDYCEEYPELAMIVNGESIKKFIQSMGDARMIFISSDAVFPDKVHLASEKDGTNPENVYGKSKELGERYIQNNRAHNCAIRTTIVGKNINPANQGFVEWIVNSVKTGKEIALFDDVIFTPITIWHLAAELEWVIENKIYSIIHIAGREPVSKYDFGFKICEKLNLNTTLIKKVSINDFSFIAKRSKDQTMSVTHYEKLSSHYLPSMEDTIDFIVKHFGN